MQITVYEEETKTEFSSSKELAQIASVHFPIAERVPNQSGTAFDLKSFYQLWTKQTNKIPTHLMVEAADEFQATIPWEQLGQAAVLYEIEGSPLKKGFPIRLYVPDGTSKCLNVKSIIAIHFLHRQDSNKQAEYGFKNQVTVDEITKKDK